MAPKGYLPLGFTPSRVSRRLLTLGLVVLACAGALLLAVQQRLFDEWPVLSSAPPTLTDLVTAAHNDRLRPDVEVQTPALNYTRHNEHKLEWLKHCLERGDCPKNADKVVIIMNIHCHWAVTANYRGGEGVWCLSMIKSLDRQGFTVLHGGRDNWLYIHELYSQVPEQVVAVIADAGTHKGQLYPDVAKTEQRPDGIPAWKYFGVSYFTTGWQGIVGAAWVITAEVDTQQNPPITRDSRGVHWVTTGEEELQVRVEKDHCRYTFLGYELEPTPDKVKPVPWAKRPNRIYLLAKRATYFQNNEFMYNLTFWEAAHNELSKEFPGFEFVAGFEDNRSDEEKAAYDIPAVIKNLGLMPPKDFDREFAKSRAMLGIGSPNRSPSPYRALSEAVPFIHPHRLRTEANAKPGEWGHMQHSPMREIPEPYVYQVEAFNYTSFVGALRKALSTPIEPLRFERQRADVFDKRMADFMTHDWRSDAAEILEARKAGRESQPGTEHDLFVL